MTNNNATGYPAATTLISVDKMWTSKTHNVDECTTKMTLNNDVSVLSFRTVINLWRDDAAFQEFFSNAISTSAFDAFFWETPAVTTHTLDSPFEFVLVRSSSLSQLTPDPSAFQRHFSRNRSESVLRFPNLGGDAMLVVPAPIADETCYTHLAQFLRNAPRSQIDAFWRTVGVAMHERISSKPTWLSTAGLGVSWLHLRLDSRPKYYRYQPYTNIL